MGKGSQEEKQTHEGDEGSENLLGGESSAKKVVSETRSDGTPVPPDGGWGWVVVIAGFLCNMVLDGIGYSFGILLNPLMEHYGVGKGLMSLVGLSSLRFHCHKLIDPFLSDIMNTTFYSH